MQYFILILEKLIRQVIIEGVHYIASLDITWEGVWVYTSVRRTWGGLNEARVTKTSPSCVAVRNVLIIMKFNKEETFNTHLRNDCNVNSAVIQTILWLMNWRLARKIISLRNGLKMHKACDADSQIKLKTDKWKMFVFSNANCIY